MSEPLTITVAKTLVGIMLSKGSSKILELIKEKRLVQRAVGEAASRCGGFALGGTERMRGYLNDWTSSPEFDLFLASLSRGEDLNQVLEGGLNSFLERSKYSTGDSKTTRQRADRIVAELLQALRDEIYNASDGRAAMMRRKEQMHSDVSSRFDSVDTGLAQIRNEIKSLKAPAREAVSQYLSKSHEWQPLKELIDKGALHEATTELESRLEQLDQLRGEHPKVEPFLRDHRQDLLLKLAHVLSQRGQTSEAEHFYDQAKALDITTPQRRQQALTVLLNLQRLDEYETLLREGDVPEPKKAELDLFVLKEAWDELAERVPADAEEFRPLYLGVLAELQCHREDGSSLNAAELTTRLDRAAAVAGEHPLRKVQLATVTINLLERVVHEMLEAPDLDRAMLVDTARTRTQEALTTCASADPDMGYYLMLKDAYTLYRLLQDEEQLRKLEEIYTTAAGESLSAEEWEEALSKGLISQAQHLYLNAEALLENPAGAQKEKAISLLQSALHLAKEPRVRFIIARRLINLHLKDNDSITAERVIQQLTTVPAHELPLLEAPIIYNKNGRPSAIEQLAEAVQRYPLNLPLRRTLATHLVAEIGHRAGTGAAPPALKPLVEEAVTNEKALQRILPTPTHSLLAARAYFAARDYKQALTLVTPLTTSPSAPLEAGQIRAQALINLQRFDEAAGQLADLAERTGDSAYATNAAAYWLHTHEYERVITLLEPWVEAHPEDPFLAANLAVTLIIARSNDLGEGRRAFNLLSGTCRRHPGLKNAYLWMARAADIAGKNKVAQRYFQKAMPKQPPITVREKKDFEEMPQAANGSFTVVQFEGEESLRAFVEWQQEQTDAVNRLLTADLLGYGDLFARHGRAWEHWVQWTQVALEQFREHSETTAVKAPWPFTERKRSGEGGLLLDLTALLTLSVLPEPEHLLRSIHAAGRQLHLRSGDLDALRNAVASPVDHLFGSVQLPYEDLVDTLRRHDLLPSFTEEEVNRFLNAVPAPLREHLGKSAFDFGLNHMLGDAVFVSDRHDTTNYEPEYHNTFANM